MLLLLLLLSSPASLSTLSTPAGSCGRCYEVACRPTYIRDGYGSSMDRRHSCYSGKSVIVTVTDTCPCYYPSNAYSNKRW
jgi:hypothetical protein